ncbi:hypothetical protein HOS76_gp14 [Pseudomonas phage Henninger]|uniref:Uncharacterized protein n=1 Tax=Pseudomonas phage Henninger TaxID=2079287 RepID=A0A2K9VHE2_9CAUD|nr:hypothetical protein HOS76_gp14 [Pseudomonas phage Henninger]AUV61708.1 hypothetical protein PsPhHenninger_gp39 [Pseudomonas phage Henninger]
MGDINKQHGNTGWALNWLIDTAYYATPTLFNNLECYNRALNGHL